VPWKAEMRRTVGESFAGCAPIAGRPGHWGFRARWRARGSGDECSPEDPAPWRRAREGPRCGQGVGPARARNSSAPACAYLVWTEPCPVPVAPLYQMVVPNASFPTAYGAFEDALADSSIDCTRPFAERPFTFAAQIVLENACKDKYTHCAITCTMSPHSACTTINVPLWSTGRQSGLVERVLRPGLPGGTYGWRCQSTVCRPLGTSIRGKPLAARRRARDYVLR